MHPKNQQDRESLCFYGISESNPRLEQSSTFGYCIVDSVSVRHLVTILPNLSHSVPVQYGQPAKGNFTTFSNHKVVTTSLVSSHHPNAKWDHILFKNKASKNENCSKWYRQT